MITPLVERLQTAMSGATPIETAERIGVPLPALKKVLAGTSTPNATTAERYRVFLTASETEFADLLARSRAPRQTRKPRAAASETAKPRRQAPASRPRAVAPAGDVARAAKTVAAFLEDELALRVHLATSQVRDIIGRILG